MTTTTKTATTYAVYVADDNGWGDGCPDPEGVFFGNEHGGRYVCGRDGAEGVAGHVEFATREEAERLLAELQTSGDWTVTAPGHEAEGQERRPQYAVAVVE